LTLHSNVPTKWWQHDSMEEVARVIRLVRKYHADELRMHFVEIFKTAWPATLTGWDTHEREMERLCDEGELPQDEDDDENVAEGDKMSYRRNLPDPGKVLLQ
jgi:hypothetical protein